MPNGLWLNNDLFRGRAWQNYEIIELISENIACALRYW